MISPEWKARHIADLIRESNSTVVFTGAGISTESGIPDFRSKGGLWDGKDPYEVSNVRLVQKDPNFLFGFYAQRYKEFKDAKPNKAHHVLARWEEEGIIDGIVTQNIDGYHRLAGSQNVVELHGDMRVRCDHCGALYDPSIYEQYTEDHIQLCTRKDVYGDEKQCRGCLRPNVVLFEEMLSDTAMNRAYHLHNNADLCIIIGSSCAVHPANILPQNTIYRNAGKIVIINKGETDLDYLASYKINEWGCSLVLETIDKILEE